MPDAPCTSGSMTTAASSPAWAATAAQAFVGPAGIGVAGRAHDREAQRFEHGTEHPAVAERERAHRVAVIRVAEGEEARPPLDSPVDPVLERDLQGLFDGHGPVGGEQEMGSIDRHHAGQRLGQLDHDRVAVAQHRAVGHLGCLGDQSGVELGHPVPERVDPEGRDRIEVAAPVAVDQLAPLGPVDDQRRVVDVRPHLREAVPDDGSIAGDPVAPHVRPCSHRTLFRTCGRGARPRPCGPAAVGARRAAP